MKKLKDLYENLEKYRDYSIGNNADNFLKIIDQIVALNNPASIGELIKYFNDNNNESWVLEELMLSLENFEDAHYVQNILIHIKRLYSQSTSWAKSIMYGILNNPTCLSELKNNLHLGDSIVLRSLFNTIQNESSEHFELINKLKEILAKHEMPPQE